MVVDAERHVSVERIFTESIGFKWSIIEIDFLCLNHKPIKAQIHVSFVRNPVKRGKLPPTSTHPQVADIRDNATQEATHYKVENPVFELHCKLFV